MSALLEVADVHIAYGKVEAVRGVSLQVADNEIVTIIGANGAGKTHAAERRHGRAAAEGPRQLRRRGHRRGSRSRTASRSASAWCRSSASCSRP